MQDQSLTAYPDEPIYNMKAVTQRTGIPAATLRAWERRYHALAPSRSDGNYRLYSERDIAVLRWLQAQMDAGLSISRAVALLEHLRARELATSPQQDPPGNGDTTGNREAATPPPLENWKQLSDALYTALTQVDEQRAGIVLAEAFALYSVEDICLQVITPCLVRIGDAWFAGSITVVTEHFASSYLLARLLILFNTLPARKGALVLVGCAPGERHEIGVLILALLLRRAGHNVRYLGAEVPLADLVRSIQQLRPRVLALSAMTAETAARLSELPDQLHNAGSAVHVLLGGQGFIADGALAKRLLANSNFSILGTDLQAGLASVQQLLMN